MFNVLNLQSWQWSAWRYDEVPDMDDFAYFFDQMVGMLFTFGGYVNGQKSNALYKIDVANR